ncbi:peptidoglycan-binding domain-containing protein [Ferrovibrio sp.]|uniref:peptidoglycan-binding domain-containing protein n=1 Tax=Ferrovibrio sp. TaxID=1917215 RepID=UPI000CB2F4E7|nr:peptidoglycan-binding domain-containing protein [Ferrovibrio sp.]PJI37498.1 MAG: hypothetical protein CTR53_20280 [Ferrovibrio sp.]
MSLTDPFAHLFGPSPVPEPEAGTDPFGRIGAGNPDWETVRGRWMGGASLNDIFGDTLFRLNRPVGTGRANQRGDVFKLQALLHREGMLDAESTGGPTGYWGNRDDAAMRDYQKDGGLTVDGWAAPDGPTLAALRRGYEAPVQYAQAATRSGVMSDAMSASSAAPDDAWADSPIHADFRKEIHRKESEGAGNSGYAASNNGAYGRYQMRVPALKDAGLIDRDGNWTGKYGLNSFEDFLRQPEAQERAFADFMARTEGYVRQIAPGYEGSRIEGARAPFEVTESGLVAAAHRQGAAMLVPYFEFQQDNNWKSGNFEKISDSVAAQIAKLQDGVANPQSADKVLRSIETRLREFSGIPYRRMVPGS